MNRFKDLTVAVESKMVTDLADYFTDDKSSRKSSCIHTDVKELKKHMEEEKGGSRMFSWWMSIYGFGW